MIPVPSVVAYISNIGFLCASAYFLKNGNMSLFWVCTFGLVCQVYNTWANYICRKDDEQRIDLWVTSIAKQAIAHRHTEFFEKVTK